MTVKALSRADEDSALAPGPITVLRTQLEQRAAEFEMILPRHISPDKFQRTLLTAAQSNPDLLDCDRRSLLTACMKAAQDGLLPDGREAAIVPFNTRTKIAGEWKWVKLAQYMPMVFGLRKKILQSEEVIALHSAVVYRQELDAERFIYREGSEHKLYHAPIMEPDFRPKDEDIVLAYSVATLANGYQSYEVMRRWEIDEVREASQTGAEFDAKGNPRDAKGPWVDWFSEMAKKTVIRRHSKSLPQSSDVLADVEGEDMAFASRSALALLDSRRPDPPTPVEDAPKATQLPADAPITVDETVDQETGEILETPPVSPEPDVPVTPPPPPPEPDPEPDPEPAPEAGPEDEPEDEPEPEDESGAFAHKRTAEEFISRAKTCTLLVDFRKLEREAEMELAEMPVEYSAPVDECFEQTRKRLTPRKNP